jgi:hypothetical protein
VTKLDVKFVKVFGSCAYMGLLEKRTSQLSQCHNRSSRSSDYLHALPAADLPAALIALALLSAFPTL